MRVAWCGPISVNLLASRMGNRKGVPAGYVYPLGAYFVEELLGAGHSVTVVTTGAAGDPAWNFRGDSLEVIVLPRRSAGACARDFFREEVRAATVALRKAEPDVVHAQWTYEFADSAIRSGLPSVVTARDSAPAIFRHLRDRYRFVRLLYSYWVVPRIRMLAVPSPYLARQYTRWYGRRRAIVVPNGLRDVYFQSEPVSTRSARTRIVAITGWDDRKNPKVLLAGFAQARAEQRSLALVLVGSGLNRDGPGAAWARENGCDAGVDFRGSLPHESVMRILRDEGDIFVHTTLEESFCMAIVEAMAANVPVVAGRNSGAVPWILGDGRFGVLVDVRSAKSVATGILKLASCPEKGTALARAAAEMARSNFGLRGIVRQYIGLYEHVLSSKG